MLKQKYKSTTWRIKRLVLTSYNFDTQLSGSTNYHEIPTLSLLELTWISMGLHGCIHGYLLAYLCMAGPPFISMSIHVWTHGYIQGYPSMDTHRYPWNQVQRLPWTLLKPMKSMCIFALWDTLARPKFWDSGGHSRLSIVDEWPITKLIDLPPPSVRLHNIPRDAAAFRESRGCATWVTTNKRPDMFWLENS